MWNSWKIAFDRHITPGAWIIRLNNCIMLSAPAAFTPLPVGSTINVDTSAARSWGLRADRRFSEKTRATRFCKPRSTANRGVQFPRFFLYARHLRWARNPARGMTTTTTLYRTPSVSIFTWSIEFRSAGHAFANSELAKRSSRSWGLALLLG